MLSQIEFEAKGYGLKHSIANLMNQPSTLHITCNYCIRLYQLGQGSIAFGVQSKLEALLLAHLTNKESLKTD